MTRHGALARLAVSALLAVTAGCGSSTTGSTSGAASPAASGGASGQALSLTLYTSVTQQTVDAVVAGYKAAHAGARVDVFRAPTGQLNARIAADQRAGGVRADVVWGTDPLSMQSYAGQHLLQQWPAKDVTGVPAPFTTPYFYGTRLLHMVIVAHRGLTPLPRSWADLADARYRGAVAVPDPAFAGSAFAALGYFAQEPGFGLDFYRRLKANGAVQVSAVPEVVTAVAQGRYKLGMTLDSEVRSAIKKGSPIEMVWPKPGAITLYSPIGATAASKHPDAAAAFLRYVLSPDGQRRIGATGWQPVLAGVPGPPKPAGAAEVSPDWTRLFGRQRDLLREYQTIFAR